MIWVWAGLIFWVSVGLLFLRPLQISFCSNPWSVGLTWWGLAYDWSVKGKNQLKVCFIPFDLNKFKAAPQKVSKKKKSPPGQAKSQQAKTPRFLKPSFALVKATWQSPGFKKILTRLRRFLQGCFRSIRLYGVQGRVGRLDYFQTGVLKGLLYNLSAGRRFDFDANFTGEDWVQVKLRLYLWRIFVALIWLLCSFPYLSFWRIYKFWLNPAR